METESLDPKTGQKRKERKKVLRKIPAKVLRNAQGIIIFSAMRNGIAPFGGSGGAGVIMARLEDGSKLFSKGRFLLFDQCETHQSSFYVFV